jgi:hypothetical protein
VHPSLLPPPTTADRRAVLARAPAHTGIAVDPLDPLLLAEIAAGLAHAVAHALPADTAGPTELLRTSRYAAWRLVWPAASAWDHDDRSPGVLHVVRGELVEHWTNLVHAEHDLRIARAGDTIGLGGAMATHIENRGPAAAVVVHVSSPPTRASRPCPEQLRLVS